MNKVGTRYAVPDLITLLSYTRLHGVTTMTLSFFALSIIVK